MKVAEVMKRPVRTCRAEERLDNAVRTMRDHDCGCVVVVDGRGRAVGVVTDRDVSLCALRTLKALDALIVRDAMSENLQVARPEEDVRQAEATMAMHQVRRLPVVDGDRRPLGMLSLDDLAREASRERGLFARQVSAEDVGLTLASVTRPRIVVDVEGRKRERPAD